MRRAAAAPGALAALAAAGALTLGGCTAAAQDGTAPPGGDVTLTVFAAASLADGVESIADGFEAEHPGVRVRVNAAGSSVLAEQITAGAPADVFAPADEATMDRLAAAGEVTGTPRALATNALTLVTPLDDPAGVGSLAEATAAGVTLVACAPQVPCGAAARSAAAREGLDLSPVSEESSVTDVLGKVTSGQADAGLVYVTDAARAGDAVRTVPLEHAPVNAYPIAPVAGSAHPDLAEAFTDYARGPAGQRVLRAAGFGAP